MADTVDVLHRPIGAAVRLRKYPRRPVPRPGVSLHLLITVTVRWSVGRMQKLRDGGVETANAAVERIAKVKQNVLGQVYRKVRRIDVAKARVQVLNPRSPPLDVNVTEVDATFGRSTVPKFRGTTMVIASWTTGFSLRW